MQLKSQTSHIFSQFSILLKCIMLIRATDKV